MRTCGAREMLAGEEGDWEEGEMEEGEDENDLQTRNVFTSNPSWRLILV